MSSNEWKPKRGERVIAVLPGGHEIEGEYLWGTYDGRAHWVKFSDDENAWVRTVKQLPVTEPTAQLARIIDGAGVRRFRRGRHWIAANCFGTAELRWADLPQPVTVIDADPDWGDAR